MLKEFDMVYIATDGSSYLDEDEVKLIPRNKLKVYLYSKGTFSLRKNGRYCLMGHSMDYKWLKLKNSQQSNVRYDEVKP